MSEKRQGRLTNSEVDFIKKHGETMTCEDIANKLNRDPDSIRDKMRKLSINLTPQEARIINAEFNIKKSAHWTQLKKQLSEDELEVFMLHWTEIVAQFKDEIPHTEKLQIIDLCKVEIIMNRILTGEQDQMKTIRRLSEQINDEKDKPKEDRNIQAIADLERQIAFAYSAQQDLNKQYRELLKEKKQMFRELKATREQRLKRLEDSKETAIGWIRKLLTEPELRRKIGRDMEKMRLAVDVEVERLSEYHVYEDGKVDQPFLTPQTVKPDNQ